jgi:hypothetical protein
MAINADYWSKRSAADGIYRCFAISRFNALSAMESGTRGQVRAQDLTENILESFQSPTDEHNGN